MFFYFIPLTIVSSQFETRGGEDEVRRIEEQTKTFPL